MKCWGVESGALARPHAELPGGKALSPSSPSSRPEPLELEERRRGTDRPFWPHAFSEAWGQSWEVAVLWGQVESQGLALGPTPWRSGVGGWLLSFPSSGPPVRERQCQQRWGRDGSKRGPTSRPCLDHAGKQEVGRLHTAGEGPLERHCWGWGLRQGASERAQRPPTPRAHRWGVA